MTKQEVLEGIRKLVASLDDATCDVVLARLSQDDAKAAHVHWKMESLIVASEQELTFLSDYINENVKE